MIRKILCLFFTLCLLLTLAACGGAGRKDASPSSGGGSVIPPAPETSQSAPEPPPEESSSQPEQPPQPESSSQQPETSSQEPENQSPDDADEAQQILQTYLEPIYYHGIGSGAVWASPRELGRWIELFDLIYFYENAGSHPVDQYGNAWPVDVMVETLSRYFDDVTADDLLASRNFGANAYDPNTNTIHYEGGRGGVASPSRVTGWTREGENLIIDYELYNRETGATEGLRRLTVRLREDGSFRYLSNLER